MSQSNQFLAGSPAMNNATDARRPQAGAAHARTATQQVAAYSRQQTRDAECVIGELVNQYFRCSTSISGTFLCW